MKPSSRRPPPGGLGPSRVVLIPSTVVGNESWSNQISTSPLASDASLHEVGRTRLAISLFLHSCLSQHGRQRKSLSVVCPQDGRPLGDSGFNSAEAFRQCYRGRDLLVSNRSVRREAVRSYMQTLLLLRCTPGGFLFSQVLRCPISIDILRSNRPRHPYKYICVCCVCVYTYTCTHIYIYIDRNTCVRARTPTHPPACPYTRT